MKSVWIPRSGPPEVLEVRDVPDPTPRPGEVLIRVRASGVNFADVSARLGLYPDAPPFPCVVGYEAAGTIERGGCGGRGGPRPGAPRPPPPPLRWLGGGGRRARRAGVSDAGADELRGGRRHPRE